MSLDNFNWGGSQQPVEFFGEKVEPQIDEALQSPVEEQTQPETPPVTEVTTEEEEQVTFFGEDPETLDLGDEPTEPGESTDKVKPEKKKTTKVDNYYNSLYLDLKDKGFYQNVELEDGQELTAEDLLDLQEQEITERIAEWGKSNIGDTGAEFLKYLRSGGDPANFLKLQASIGGLPEGDISEETYQENVIRYTLANEDWDAEEIEERVAVLKESGRLEKVAIKYDTKVREERKAAQEELIAEQKEAEKARKEKYKQYKDSLLEVAKTKSEIKGFKLTPAKATKIVENITKPSVTLESGQVLSKFQSDLNESLKDPEKVMLLAMLVDNGFDFSQIQKQADNKSTQQLKRNIQNHGVTSAPEPGSSLGAYASLADLLE